MFWCECESTVRIVCLFPNIMESGCYSACGAPSALKITSEQPSSNVSFQKSLLEIIHRLCCKQFHSFPVRRRTNVSTQSRTELANITTQAKRMPSMVTWCNVTSLLSMTTRTPYSTVIRLVGVVCQSESSFSIDLLSTRSVSYLE